jgi:serine/threonine-protein kinase
MHQHQESPPPTLGSLRPEAGFSPQLEAVVSKALAKKPEDRFASATDFATALEALPEVSATPAPLPALPPAASPAPSSPKTEALARPGKGSRRVAGAAGLLMAGFAVVLLWPRGQDEAPVSSTPATPPGRTSPVQPPAASAKGATGAEPPAIAPEPLPNIKEIERMVREKRRDPALRALAKLRAQHPTSAYAPYLEGHVNFDNLRWVDGLASYGAAIRNNPAYRSDPTLIRNLIECLVSDRFHDECEAFLVREVGAPAIPFLEEASRSHAFASVQSRAARLLSKVNKPR